MAAGRTTPLLPYVFHVLESSPLHVPPIGPCPSLLPQSFSIGSHFLVPPLYRPHALRSLVSGARPASVLKPGLCIVPCFHPWTPSWCGCNKPPPVEPHTRTPPASLPSTHFTRAIRACVCMCECMVVLPSGFANETLLGRSEHLTLQHCKSRSTWLVTLSPGSRLAGSCLFTLVGTGLSQSSCVPKSKFPSSLKAS